MTGMNNSVIANSSGTQGTQLGDFLSRPTLIANYSWNEGGVASVLQTIKPWHLFFNNTQIRKKIDNYAFIRCNLHIKVLINASPFYYGLAISAYNPLEGITSNPVRASTSFAVDLVTYSQFPHIKIQPSESAGGEMQLGFLYHKNWLSLTSAQDLQDMGTLRLIACTPLNSANGVAGQSVTVSTYAWATDVEVMGPTVTLAVQSKDEYADGPVSRPASAIAAVANRLSDLPVIGSFAKATAMGATAVSKIAALFGYTNVPVIDPVHAFQNSNLPMLASAGIGTAVEKLTLDPKSELSIDPGLHGLSSEDVLSISRICGHEALLTSIAWNVSDSVDTQIFNARVNPVLSSSYPETNATRYGLIPAAYIGRLFQYWRGDIIFRFKVVCSKYHKGRIRITYDPVGRIDTNSDSQNVTFTTILDIGECNDAEFTIPYHQAASFQRVRVLDQDNWSSGNSLGADSKLDNGQVSVRVLNTLSAPVAVAPAYLVVYVRMGENFEFAVPMSGAADNFPLSLYSVQSEDTIELTSRSFVIGENRKPHPQRHLMNFGEAVVSLRSVLQRASIAEVSNVVPLSANLYARWYQLFGRMPLLFGFDPNGLTLATKLAGGASTINFVPFHPLPFVTAMFKGYRGGINWHFNVESRDYQIQDNIQVVRHGNNRSVSDRAGGVLATLSTGVVNSAKVRFLNDTSLAQGAGGMGITSQRNNNSLSVCLPDYNAYNFNLFAPLINNLGSDSDDSRKNTYQFNMFFSPTTAATQNTETMTVTKFVNAGVDFTPIFFQACPTVDVYASLPAAA